MQIISYPNAITTQLQQNRKLYILLALQYIITSFFPEETKEVLF